MKTKTDLQFQTVPTDIGVHLINRGIETRGGKLRSVLTVTLMSYVVTLLLSLGAVYTFTTMFAIRFNAVVLPVVIATFAFVMLLLYQLPKKIVAFSLLGLLVLYGVAFAVFYGDISSGFTYIRDNVLVGIAASMRWKVPELGYVFNTAMEQDTTMVLCFTAIPVIVGVCYATVRRINFFLGFLFTFPFFEIGAAFGCVPNHLFFGLLLAGWTGLLTMYAAVKINKIRAKRKAKKKSKTSAAKVKQGFVATMGVLVAVLTLLIFSFSNFMITAGGYDRPENIRELRRTVKSSVSDFIDYVLNDDHDGSMKEGRLYELGTRVVKDRRYLTVQAPRRESLYLKGYVGEEYQGDRWAAFDNDASYQRLLDAYKSQNMYPQQFQGALLKDMVKKRPMVDESKATITISNLRRKKNYAFTAYLPYFETGFSFARDTYATPSNKSQYSYTAYMDERNYYIMNIADKYYDKQFSELFKSYTAYVKTEYTKLPQGMGRVSKIVEDLIDGKKYKYATYSASNFETADRIRTYLANNCKYSLEAGKLPKGEDFVENFLFTTKEGYASHFATAMTVMLRTAGVPARYVEGYYAKGELYKTAEKDKDGYYTLDLTDENAHAWVEIYEANYGWIPVEVTPGFYTGSLMDDLDSSTPLDNVQDENAPMQITDTDNFIEDPDSENIFYAEPPVEEKPIEPTFLQKLLPILLAIGKYTLYTFAGLLLVAISGCCICLIVLFIRRKIVVGKRRHAMTTGNRNGRVIAVYRYYNRLLRFEGIENTENLPYLQYASYICAHSTHLQGEAHLRAMQIFLRFRFSGEPLTDTDLKELEGLAETYSTNTVQALRGKEKFRFKYFFDL